MKCKICDKFNDLNKSYLYTHSKIKYYRCKYCLFIFQHPLPNNKELKSFMTKIFFQNYFNKNSNYKLRKIQYKLDKKIILNHFDDYKTKEILDYGCGNGEFLSLFKSKKMGFEFNENAIVNKDISRLTFKGI